MKPFVKVVTSLFLATGLVVNAQADNPTMGVAENMEDSRSTVLEYLSANPDHKGFLA